MANNHLNLEPHRISDNSWWYEESDGVHIIVRSAGLTTEHKIGWAILRRALARKDKPKAEN